jgi:hypothetical protein
MVSTRTKSAFSRSPRSSFNPHVEESRADGTTHPGHVVTHDDERRTAFVDLELAAVWKGPPIASSTAGAEVGMRLCR